MHFLNRLSDSSLAIYLFHGVIKKQESSLRNYNRKHIELEYFKRFLHQAARTGTPLSMEDIVRHVKDREPLPSNAFAITFDDGFENNYSVAAPVLSEMNIPAMFYLTTDFVENNTMSWIDRIEYCLDSVGTVKVKLPWKGNPAVFRTTEDKRSLLEEIRKYVKRDEDLDVDQFVDDIFRQCGLEPVFQSDDPLDKKMSWQQAKNLAGDSLFSIGGHTHTHKIMSFLSADNLKKEVGISLDLIQRNINERIRHYSYPEGLAHCYSQDVIDELKKNHIVCSPTAIDGVNTIEEDLFHLKRIMVD